MEAERLRNLPPVASPISEPHQAGFGAWALNQYTAVKHLSAYVLFFLTCFWIISFFGKYPFTGLEFTNILMS